MDELRVAIEGPDTGFAVTAYVCRNDFMKALQDLRLFAKAIHGGLCDMRLGDFGPEYANGAVHVRFHWVEGRIHLTCRMQTDFGDFGLKRVADEALIHARTEPALNDSFLAGLGSFVDRKRDEVVLELVPAQ
jgi:hypothetical protein